MVKVLGRAMGLGLILSTMGLAGYSQPATRFAMTCVGTEVGETLNFSYRWGTTGSWTDSSVDPEEWLILTWRYDTPNQNESPVLSIRYDADFTSGTSFVIEELESYASPIDKNCADYGKTYNFYTDKTGNQLMLIPED
ncbi:MAG: hypothetical protein OHK0012_18590 [Synechococcales cyanobacterium]